MSFYTDAVNMSEALMDSDGYDYSEKVQRLANLLRMESELLQGPERDLAGSSNMICANWSQCAEFRQFNCTREIGHLGACLGPTRAYPDETSEFIKSLIEQLEGTRQLVAQLRAKERR